MGAGSAKGVRKSASTDGIDNLSITSEAKWDEATGTSIKPLDEGKRSQSFEFPSTFSKKNEVRVTNGDAEEGVERSPKKGGRKIWNFFSDKDGNPDESTSEAIDINKNNKTKFKLFGKKKEPTDEKLESEINDLEKTFDSLGIVGKSVWEGGQDIKPPQKSKDDLAALEPMRNRSNVRIARPPRGMNGLTVTHDTRLDTTGSDFSSTSSNKKKFNFSWDTEEDDQSAEVDEWDYRAVKIDGFDPNKFKKANVEDAYRNGIATNGDHIDQPAPSLPISPIRVGSASTLQYDADDQQILASIERALME